MQFSYPIILGSTSPRRHELLNQCQILHTVQSIHIDETKTEQETPADYILRMVNDKAKSALTSLTADFFEQSNTVLLITADTIGVLKSGQVLQKPTNFDDACQMWQRMSDNEHHVWTAVQVSQIQRIDNTAKIINHQQRLVKTSVQFIPLTHSMMRDYWHTGEPHDKAGGYAIQGMGAMWVKAINGSYSNVVGLPIVETVELLKHF